jgi:DNA ligase-1
MTKLEFVPLCETFNPDKHMAAGGYVSAKLDGERAIWDGGISRGIPSAEVPYANTVKDGSRKNQQIATGLWSRTGKIIHAPDWFLDLLPQFPLDGELWAGNQNWQLLSSTVHQEFPDERWRSVEYKIIDSPSLSRLLVPRVVKVRNDYSFSVTPGALFWANSRRLTDGVPESWSFEFVYRWLQHRFSETGVVSLVKQLELSFNHYEALAAVDLYARQIVEDGGEGVVIRKRNSIWWPTRSLDLLKYKPSQDDEGKVTGYYTGKLTDKGSKLLGMMGALELEYQGKIFKISGFNEKERPFSSGAATDWAIAHPGERCPDWIENAFFPKGAMVTFTYRELTDGGIPKDARFLRKES